MPKEEKWMPVPIRGFEHLYEVSNLGRVKSIGTFNTCKRGIMSPMTDTSGYFHVRLYNNNRRRDVSIHRLVALAFIPNPNHYGYVNHKDKSTTNNKADNLEWCTNSYNITYSKGLKVACYSLSGELIKTYDSISLASADTKVPHPNISKCCKGKRMTAGQKIWKYVR